MRKIEQWLREQDRIALIPHVSPDGDAYGSTLAMCMALRVMGKQAFVAAEPVPSLYDFLPGQELIFRKEDAPFAPQAVFYMDVSTPDRAICTFPEVTETALLDHHETNAGFAGVEVIEGHAASTGELVVRLLKQMALPVTKDMAICLYTAISTDTGNFQYGNTTPEALQAVADLLGAGLPISQISEKLFRERTLARTQLLGKALNALETYDDGRIALTVITKEMLRLCNAGHAETEQIVNYCLEIRGVEAAAMLEERDGETKVSLRSHGRVDIAAVAKQFGGGGHFAAAGATLKLPPQESRDAVLQAMTEAVHAIKE